MLRIDREHQPIEKAPPLAAGPVNSPSIAGVSQTRRRWSAKARAEATGARSMRLSALGAAVRRRLQPDAELAAIAVLLDLDRDREAAGPAVPRAFASSARRKPRPGENSDSASRRLVLPAPFSPPDAITARRARDRAPHRSGNPCSMSRRTSGRRRAWQRLYGLDMAAHVPRPAAGERWRSACQAALRWRMVAVAQRTKDGNDSVADFDVLVPVAGHGGNRRADRKARRRCIGSGWSPIPRRRSPRSRRASRRSSRPRTRRSRRAP